MSLKFSWVEMYAMDHGHVPLLYVIAHEVIADVNVSRALVEHRIVCQGDGRLVVVEKGERLLAAVHSIAQMSLDVVLLADIAERLDA